ncbi:MAG: hypothetical protein JWP89_868 [Schlesneria sp.]|nr:hypothetical protein [Schlesneria sp.]
MPDFKLVFSVAEEEITRDIDAASDSEAITAGLEVLQSDPHQPDIGTLLVKATDDDYEPLCSLRPKPDNDTQIRIVRT